MIKNNAVDEAKVDEAKDAKETIIGAVLDRIAFTADWSVESKDELARASDPARIKVLEERVQIVQGIAEQLEAAREALAK